MYSRSGLSSGLLLWYAADLTESHFRKAVTFMFTQFSQLVSWVLDSSSSVWDTVLNNWGYIGVMIIGLPIVRKVVSLMRKIF